MNEPTNVICPKCGEDNPAGATICWACYTPLGLTVLQQFEARNEREKRRKKRRKLTDAALMTSLFGGVSLSIASGYLPRHRFWVLGSGLLAASAPIVWMGWRDFQSKREQSQSQSAREAEVEPVGKGERRQRVEWQAALVLLLGGTSTLVASGYSARNRRELLGIGTFALLLFGVLLKCDAIQSKRREAETQLLVESPAVRYVNEILRYSILQNAGQIRFQTGYRGASVEYLVGEEWKNGVPIPIELWDGMRTEFSRKSGGWREEFSVSIHGRAFLYTARFERDSLNETLTLTRQEPK